MKYPKCDGTGFVPTNVFGVNGAIKCDFCDGTGVFITNAVEPMTNEEWLKSLDTERLVDYLYEVHKGGNSVERQRWIENHKERVKMQFRGWLKQPHTNKE